jgi:hypothetical protein
MKLESPVSLANVDDLEPLAYSVKDLVRRLPLCRSTVEGLIRRGELEVAQVEAESLSCTSPWKASSRGTPSSRGSHVTERENEQAYNQGVDDAKRALVSVVAVIPPSYAIGRAALEIIVEGLDGLKFPGAGDQRQ